MIMAYSNLVKFLIILIGGLLLGFIGFAIITEVGIQAEGIKNAMNIFPKLAS
ncbi:MAG: hypothetical protein QXI10_03445 [Candidatus Diapherotrites archaeon]